MSQRGFSKMESGTCNVCSAPCSSCMHTVSKSDESSDENSHGVVGSQCSVNEEGLLPSSMVNARNCSNTTASEASNVLNPIHDALSENAESKETMRCSGISDDSEVVAMTSKTFFPGSRMEHKVSASANVLDQSCNNIHGQKDGVMSDDRIQKVNSGYPNNKIVNKDLSDGLVSVSGPVLGRSTKDQDSTMIEDSNVLPNEAKTQCLHNPLSYHEDRISSELVNFKESLGPGVNKETDESSGEKSTPSGQNGKNGKSSKSTSFKKSDTSESESDDSEMVEHDVKVCDICGDAGREDLLAICTGCSDGAEHTYCMRERLNEVPEGDWFCEECKFAEGAKKQKQVEHIEAKRKREAEVTLNTRTSGKGHADKTEANPDAKRQAVEGSSGSPKKSILPRISALSREASFKGLDKSRGKLNHQISDDTEGARSTGSQLQSLKGAILKSTSFNYSSSKPKVQLMENVVLPRKKTGKEYPSLETKEGAFRNVGKSMTSRTTDAGSPSGNDSQAKMLASKVSHSQEVKSPKLLKDRSIEANASVSSTDQKLISRCNSSASYANNTRDLKGLQSDGKRGSLTKQVSNLNRNRTENPSASGGDFSTNEKCSASKQSSSQADCKDELPSTSCLGEGVPSNGNVASQDGFREVWKKSKEAFGKRQRSSLLSGAKSLPSSQKGGQTAECSDTSGVPDSDLSTTKNVREDINKGNRLRAAVDAALRKKPNFGKNRGLEQSDASLESNVDSSSDKTLRNQLPSKMQKKYVSPEGLQGGHPTLRPVSDPYKPTVVTNEKQIVLSGADMPPRPVELEVNFSSVKPVIRDWPLVAPPALLRSSAIPDHESIWQGDLEVWKTRNQSAMHSGMQAHLSTLASPKVAEVVNKLPQKFRLNEVPRLSIWPAQFQDIGTKENHIALFFFAKDVESYERNYKPLVDNMIKKDLALKGDLDNVELLIFASNQLPPNCQRWNMLYFLWGVFRGRKKICTNPQKNTSLPTSNVLPNDRNPTDLCQTSSPRDQDPNHVEKAASLRESSDNRSETQNRKDVFGNENPSDRKSSIEQSTSRKEEIVLKENEPGANHIPCQATGSNSRDSLVNKVQQTEDKELGGRKDLSLTVTGSENQSRGQENPLEKDLNCSQSSQKKRPVWELARPSPENSSAMNQTVDLNNDGICEGSLNKKLKTEKDSSLFRDTSRNDSGIMEKSPRVVFPLDLNAEREDTELDDDVITLGSSNEENKKRLISGTVPDLEVALGSEETTEDNTMGLLPFFAERSNTGGQSSNGRIKDEEEEEDAASLSLSLAFPGEERKNVNTPLFLFRDLPR